MVKYKVIKDYYSREEIEVLKRKKSNLSFNNKDRWKFHFKDNARFNIELSRKIECRIPERKKTSSPIILNNCEESKSFYIT